jgi:hypothetical protein
LSGTSSSTYTTRLRNRVDELRSEAAAMAARSRAQVADAERRAREARQRADAVQRHAAAMEATISWRVTAPLRWLSRQRNAVFKRSARPLRAAAAAAVRASVSTAKRSRLYSHVAPWLQSRYPRLWQRAKRLAIAAPIGASRGSNERHVASFATDRWEPRTTRDTTILGMGEIERLLEVEIQQRRKL